MRYLIAHMLEGEAREYHTDLSDRLAERFGLDRVSSRINPHLTLKAPFEAESAEEIERILVSFAEKERAKPMTLGGFRDFDGKVIYLDVSAPKETHMQIRRLQDKLRAVPWLTFNAYEFPVTLHATLCYPKSPEHGKEILSYLERSEKKRMFPDLSLDNITLLLLRDRWEVVKEVRLR